MLCLHVAASAWDVTRSSVARFPASALHTSRVRVAVAFGTEAEHHEHLAAHAALPEGFRVGVSGFDFTPQEADMRAVMNLTLIVLDRPSSCFAGVFTRNAFCGAPVTVGRRRLAESETVQAVVVNNKISNVCAAGDGVGTSEQLCAEVASALGIEGGAAAVIPASTGVIGWALPLPSMVDALPATVKALQRESAMGAASSIMTTDRFPKLRAASACGGRIVGIAKGAGMIEPNMATMLSFVLTDIAVPRPALQQMLSRITDESFNCISVDADQSTSDTLLCLSSEAHPLPASRVGIERC